MSSTVTLFTSSLANVYQTLCVCMCVCGGTDTHCVRPSAAARRMRVRRADPRFNTPSLHATQRSKRRVLTPGGNSLGAWGSWQRRATAADVFV